MNLNRILLVRTGALGDVILTLPVLQALRDGAPHARIELLGKPDILALAGEYAGGIHSIDRAEWTPFFVPGGLLPDRPVNRLQATDLVLSYLPDADGTFTANLRRAGAGTVVSFPPHPPPDGSVHIVDHLLRPLAGLGIPACAVRPCVRLTPEDRRAASRLLQDSGLSGVSPLILHPGSGGVSKRWPPERFAGVADRAVQETGLPVLLLSGPADGDLADRVGLHMQTAATVIPALPLTHLAALLECAAVYLGNDSGPTHLAAAVGAPVVALFGPTDPRIWAPRGAGIRVLQAAPALPPPGGDAGQLQR